VIHSHLVGIIKHSLLALEAEEVAGPECDGTQRVDTAAGRPQAIPSGHTLIPPEGEDVAQDAPLWKGTDLQTTLQELQGTGKNILCLQPGKWEEFPVGDFHIQGSLIAEEEALTTQAAPIGDPRQAVASPQSGGQDHQYEKDVEQQQSGLSEEDADKEETPEQ